LGYNYSGHFRLVPGGIAMKLCRWFGALILLVGFAVLISPSLPVLAGGDKDKKGKDKGKTEAQKKDDAAQTKGEWTWKAFDKNTNPAFYQQLTTETTQKMKVMGMEVTQEQKQTFYIKWTPKEPDVKGNWVVTQKIVGVKMDIDIGGNKISYDSTAPAQPQNPMTDFFKALLELELTFTIDKDLKVVKIDGNEEFIKKLSKTNPQMEPLLKSILSEDALKKMTEPTLFAFPSKREDREKKRWNKVSELSLGPIGSYTTDYLFTLAGKDKDSGGEKIDVKANMVYKKPTEKGKLPFQIDEGELTGKDGSGYAVFNPAKGRFDVYKMKMKLEGSLKIDIGGMKTTVDLAQDQNAVVTTSDTNPVEAAAKKK
jgi:hypothetical protein